jgi:hypothetical protein
MQALLLEQNRPTMLARIGMLRALNWPIGRVFNRIRKTGIVRKKKLPEERRVPKKFALAGANRLALNQKLRSNA